MLHWTKGLLLLLFDSNAAIAPKNLVLGGWAAVVFVVHTKIDHSTRIFLPFFSLIMRWLVVVITPAMHDRP